MVALLEADKIDLSVFEQPVTAAILIMGQDQVPYSMSVLIALRDAGISSIPYLDTEKKFKNQIEFADKIRTKFSIIIGEDEVKNQMLTVKNMKTGEQQNLSLSCATEMLKIVK